MTVSAMNKESDYKAFSSVKVGKEKLDLKKKELFMKETDIIKKQQERAERLDQQIKESEGVTEQLKEENQMEWVRRMGNIQQRAREVIYNELIYV